MLKREVQPKNAELPILVTLFGIVTLEREVQSLNANPSMAVTVWPLMTSGMSAASMLLLASVITASLLPLTL